MKRQLETIEENNKISKTYKSESLIMLKSNHEPVGRIVSDVWAHVFTYLEATRELLPNVMPVCKMFYNILGGGEGKSLVYERVSIAVKDGYPTSSFLKIRKFDRDYLNRLLDYIINVSPKNGCKVLHLGSIDEYNESLSFELTSEFFKRCISSGVFDGLKELRLANSFIVFLRDEEQLDVFTEWISRLKELEILIFGSLFPNKILDCIFTGMPKLKKLRIDLGEYEIGDSFPILENLEYFDVVSGNESFSSTTLVSLFKHAPNLRKLKMGYCMAYENAVFLGLVEHCKKLSDLTFGERYLNESDNLPIITNQLHSLESLNLFDGLPYGEHLLDLDKLTKLKKFDFNFDEFSGCDDDGVLKELFPKLKGLTWARFGYIKNEAEDEEHQEEEERDNDENVEQGFVELANKKFPNLETLYLLDSELEELTLTQLFEGIPHLKNVTLEVLAAGCDQVFESIEADIQVRKDASNRVLQLFGEISPSVELFEDRIFYHRIGEKKLRIKLVNIDYDGIVKFKIQLVH
ncbi:predicted protein [Naegleria gruberi]|uniref:Predicted protein n=1 Tax=Naegleria gruberi TaxID=5762 RepID=D2VGU1_NAEGR|nr:uncharacterized protein NAEGRDRAFT_49419 [Naegleria gruberi]EFC44120.1 predicted protein [Naegleria gruberi]|eukprot:XP_002676864.1 predicted protein [Naegleria gruberi strain NEG-M]